jgi:hypothetical protein
MWPEESKAPDRLREMWKILFIDRKLFMNAMPKCQMRVEVVVARPAS